MLTPKNLSTVLGAWTTLLGAHPTTRAEDPGRELWPVTAEDGTDYFLKRLGPWRNLPVADEARILRWLSHHQIDVAEFMITDRAALFAGSPEDSFVLIPRLAADPLSPGEILGLEDTIGRAIARLHQALAAYPWSANSYQEGLTQVLQGDLLLPPDLADRYAEHRDDMATVIGQLPVQLVHGDLTPDNILLRRAAPVAGFIDFDHLPLAPRVWDIAKYLSRRLRLRWQSQEKSDNGRLAHLAPLIHGYHRASPLTASELRALPAAIAAGNIIEASYGQQIASGTLERRKLPDHDETLADTIDTARWHFAHYDAVEHTVRSAIN